MRKSETEGESERKERGREKRERKSEEEKERDRQRKSEKERKGTGREHKTAKKSRNFDVNERKKNRSMIGLIFLRNALEKLNGGGTCNTYKTCGTTFPLSRKWCAGKTKHLPKQITHQNTVLTAFV